MTAVESRAGPLYQLPALPWPLTRAAGVWAGDRIILLGGESSDVSASSLLYDLSTRDLRSTRSSLSSLEAPQLAWRGDHGLAYWTSDSGSDTWSARFDKGASTSMIRSADVGPFQGAAFGYDGRNAYFFGGLVTEGGSERPSDRIVRVEPESGKWQVLKSPTRGLRWEGAAVYAHGRFYVLGGVIDGEPSSTIYSWEPLAGGFAAERATLPPDAGHSDAGVAWDGEAIYLFGGVDRDGAATARIYKYRPGAERVEAVEQTLPSARSGVAAVYADGRIYLLGGSDAFGRPLAEMLMYDPPGEAANEAPVARLEAALASDNRSVVVDASTSTDANGYVASLEVVWGDGSEPTYGAYQVHTYARPGNYHVTVRATDELGARSSAARSIHVPG